MLVVKAWHRLKNVTEGYRGSLRVRSSCPLVTGRPPPVPPGHVALLPRGSAFPGLPCGEMRGARLCGRRWHRRAPGGTSGSLPSLPTAAAGAVCGPSRAREIHFHLTRPWTSGSFRYEWLKLYQSLTYMEEDNGEVNKNYMLPARPENLQTSAHQKKPLNTTPKLLELISKFSKITECKQYEIKASNLPRPNHEEVENPKGPIMT